MNKDIKDKWVAALRSGQFRQGQHKLKSADDGPVTHCCLGVLCEIIQAPLLRERDRWMLADGDYGARSNYLTQPILDQVDLPEEGIRELARMNDQGTTFEEIADHIEREL